MMRSSRQTLNDKSKYHKQQRRNATLLARLLTGNKCVLLLATCACLASFTVVPIWLLEAGGQPLPASVAKLEHELEAELEAVEHQIRGAMHQNNDDTKADHLEPHQIVHDGHRTTKDGRVLPALTLDDLDTTLDRLSLEMPVARGIAGAPLSETPALVGAVRAHIDCDVNVDSLAYWNDPIGARDLNFQSPFSAASDGGTTKYITFAPDRGGWNNIRMSMEIIFVIAAATGRTLVLPPKEPLYLLQNDAAARHRGFADFFPIHTAQFQQRVRVISFADFLEAERHGPLAPKTPELLQKVTAAADHCDLRKMSEAYCGPVFDYLKEAGYNSEVSAVNSCLVFDEYTYNGQEVPADVQEHLDLVCGAKRQQVFWDQEMQQHQLVHFRASERNYRLLTHFYGMIHFTNPATDHYYKRFVRDFLHYHDSIYCAAGKIVKAVQYEGVARGFAVDPEGAGAFSALHVRRGDLQYKKVKIPAQEWYDNTKEVWQPKEILYVATDERDKSFFDDLAKHHDLRFLDDYWDLASLGDLDPNYMYVV